MSAHGTSILAHRAVSTLRSIPRVSRASSSSRRSASARALPIIAMSAAPAEDVSLVELLSTCVDAARKGCDEIRAVQHRRSTAGGALASTRKDADDPRSALTEADTAAQIAIVNALRTAWPGLRIVGEEEEEESPDEGAALRRDLLDDACAPTPPPPPGANLSTSSPSSSIPSTAPASSSRVVSTPCSASSASRAAAAPSPAPSAFPSRTAIWSVLPPSNGASPSPAPPRARADPRRPNPSASPAPDVVDGAVCVAGTPPTPASPRRNSRRVPRGTRASAALETRFSPWRRGARRCPSCTSARRSGIRAPRRSPCARGGKVSDLFGAPLTHDPERPGGGLINDLGVLATASNLAEVDAEGRDHAASPRRCAPTRVYALRFSPSTRGRVRDAGDRPTPGVRRGAVSRRRAAHGEVGGGVRGANAVWGRVREFSSSRVCRAGTRRDSRSDVGRVSTRTGVARGR